MKNVGLLLLAAVGVGVAVVASKKSATSTTTPAQSPRSNIGPLSFVSSPAPSPTPSAPPPGVNYNAWVNAISQGLSGFQPPAGIPSGVMPVTASAPPAAPSINPALATPAVDPSTPTSQLNPNDPMGDPRTVPNQLNPDGSMQFMICQQDTPSSIAKFYTGDATRFRELEPQNPKLGPLTNAPSPADPSVTVTGYPGWGPGVAITIPAAWNPGQKRLPFCWGGA